MKEHRSIEYKKGRVIKATYLYTHNNEDLIITKKLLILEDVYEGDIDIKCLDIDLAKSNPSSNDNKIIVLPNIKNNIIELPRVFDEADINYIRNLINQVNIQYVYALDPGLK